MGTGRAKVFSAIGPSVSHRVRRWHGRAQRLCSGWGGLPGHVGERVGRCDGEPEPTPRTHDRTGHSSTGHCEGQPRSGPRLAQPNRR
jgi:hypothetical protein